MSNNVRKQKISRRRVSLFCADGRIEGAIRKVSLWLVPDKAKESEYLRRVKITI